VLVPDARPPLPRREPNPFAYPLLLVSVPADTANLVLNPFTPFPILAPVFLPLYPFLLALDELMAPDDPPRKDLEHADLAGNSFESSDRLSGANLHCANLMGADLRSANLKGADLRDARLFGARLSGADLASASNLTQAQFDVACGDERTRVPGGLRPPPACPAESDR